MTDLHPDVAASILEMTEEAGAEGLKWRAIAEEQHAALTFATYTQDFQGRLVCRLCDAYRSIPHRPECPAGAALAKFEEASK